MKRFTTAQEVEIMSLVAQVAAAAAGNEQHAWSIKNVDGLVKALFPTMCKLLGEAVPGLDSED